MHWLYALLCDDEAATAVEYAVMLGAIIAVCIAIVGSIGTSTKELMDPSGNLTSALGASS